MEEGAEVIGEHFKILFHLDGRSNRIIEFDEAGKNK